MNTPTQIEAELGQLFPHLRRSQIADIMHYVDSCQDDGQSSSSVSIDLDECVRDALEDSDIAPDPKLVSVISAAVEKLAMVRGAQAAGKILTDGLPDTPGGHTIRKFLLNDPEPTREMARRTGWSEASLRRAGKSWLRFLGLRCPKPIVRTLQ